MIQSVKYVNDNAWFFKDSYNWTLIIIIIIINSYTLVTSIRSTHEKKLCYVCWVNKTLWDRKSLIIFATAACNWNDKAETMYQICSQWLHVREWVLLSLWNALKASFSSSFSLSSWDSSWLRWWLDSSWSQHLEAYSIEDAFSLNNASEYAWWSDDFIRSCIESYSCSKRFSSADKHLVLCVWFWCELQKCFWSSENHHAFLLISWIDEIFERKLC